MYYVIVLFKPWKVLSRGGTWLIELWTDGSSFCPPVLPEMGHFPSLPTLLSSPQRINTHILSGSQVLPGIYPQTILLQFSLTPTSMDCKVQADCELNVLVPSKSGVALTAFPPAGGHLCLQAFWLLLCQRHEPAVPRVLWMCLHLLVLRWASAPFLPPLIHSIFPFFIIVQSIQLEHQALSLHSCV